VITGATATLALGLVLRDTVTAPYERTRDATAGPDVVAGVAPEPPAPVDPAELDALIDRPEVVGHSGPYPVTQVALEAGGHSMQALAQGRASTPVRIDQPRLTEGDWVRDGGVVFEAAFADTLGVGAGDRVTLDGREFRVAGVAVTTAAPPYPALPCLAGMCMEGGLVWVTDAEARSLAPGGLEEDALHYAVNLDLADPTAAEAFVEAHMNVPGKPVGTSWQDVREVTTNLVSNQRRALMTGAWLLGLLALASVAVLVGGRMADQTRRVGLLKSVGGTPGLVAAVLVAEYVLVAVLAAAAGLAVGWLVAPRLTDPTAGLLGGLGAPPLTASTVGVVTAAALAVAVAATAVPAVRAARSSTVDALADSARAPRRTAWLIALSTRLPTSLLLASRVAARRPRRVVLGVASIAVTVTGLVAALAAHADLAADQIDGSSPLDTSRADRLNQILLVITLALVALAAVNAIFITWATALDTRYSSALARALGATPRQVSAGLSAAQVLPALAGALVGIPAGIALFGALDEDSVVPPAWQLVAVVLGAAVVVAGLSAIPARLGVRRPVAEVLQSE
jgi:ABC-type lipoprotein release transport system permease subunit